LDDVQERMVGALLLGDSSSLLAIPETADTSPTFAGYEKSAAGTQYGGLLGT
jgi:hypothetical protein